MLSLSTSVSSESGRSCSLTLRCPLATQCAFMALWFINSKTSSCISCKSGIGDDEESLLYHGDDNCQDKDDWEDCHPWYWCVCNWCPDMAWRWRWRWRTLGSICISVHDLYGYRSILSNLQEPCTGRGWFGGLVWDSSCEAPVQKLTATSCHSFADHFTSMLGHHYQGCTPIRQCHQCLVRLRTTSPLLSFERMPNPSFIVDHPPKQSCKLHCIFLRSCRGFDWHRCHDPSLARHIPERMGYTHIPTSSVYTIPFHSTCSAVCHSVAPNVPLNHHLQA